MDRWYFWVLAPAFLGGAVIIVVATDPPTTGGRILAYSIAGGAVLATLGLADTRRFSWALRTVAGGVLVLYLWYAGSELRDFANGKPFGWLGPLSENSLRNALLGLLVFGIPATRYMCRGRS